MNLHETPYARDVVGGTNRKEHMSEVNHLVSTPHAEGIHEKAIEIHKDEPLEPTGASHEYHVSHTNEAGERFGLACIKFQRGPLAEAGINGIGGEQLLEIVADRLRCFQASKFACRENALALTKIEEALQWLRYRTKARAFQQVEGTHQVHK